MADKFFCAENGCKAGVCVEAHEGWPPCDPPPWQVVDQRCPRCRNYPDTPGHHYGCLTGARS